MMNRASAVDAAGRAETAIRDLATAISDFKAQVQLARDAAFDAGGTHVQGNAVERVVGGDRFEAQLFGVMKDAGLSDLINAAVRIPATAVGATSGLAAFWTDRLANSAISAYSE